MPTRLDRIPDPAGVSGMAEDRNASYAVARDEWLFTHLFRTFRVALDPRKLLLAATGIVVMACGWWLLSVTFYGMSSQPSLEKSYYQLNPDSWYENKYSSRSKQERDAIRQTDEEKRNREFNEDSERWLNLHYLAGTGYAEITYQPENGVTREKRGAWGGRLRTMPWFEERGPNPYLLVTGQAERPWERGQFADWALRTELPVLIEPLVKFLEPIVYLLHPKSGTLTQLYLLLIIFVTLATWALFGGGVTRIASVELAGEGPVSSAETLRFVSRRH